MTQPVSVFLNSVSKQYQLGESHTSLRAALLSGVRSLIPGRNGPDRNKTTLWALRDVSFEVHRGEAFGLIGPNGAGKTSILKILSRVTRPTSGTFGVRGRLSALIDLGAGFHPDLTGRENIYLNAGILGLSRAEVEKAFDRIVEFSGLESFIDTPVKRYSSGMYVRLGFSVAAHVEPDVLLVDEVLAVGDAQFRQRCAGRISELRKAGTTIVFVAHNLYLVRSICDTVAFVEGGQIRHQGDAMTAINAYETWLQAQQASLRRGHRFGPDRRLESPSSVDILEVGIENGSGEAAETVLSRDPVTIKVEFEARQPVVSPNVVLRIVRADGVTCCMVRTAELEYELGELHGRGTVRLRFDPLHLVSGAYSVEARVIGEIDGVPLSVGHSPWFTVSGETLGYHESSGVFIPKVVWAGVEPPGPSGRRVVDEDWLEADQ